MTIKGTLDFVIYKEEIIKYGVYFTNLDFLKEMIQETLNEFEFETSRIYDQEGKNSILISVDFSKILESEDLEKAINEENYDFIRQLVEQEIVKVINFFKKLYPEILINAHNFDFDY